jgi:hypothetical protein
MIKNTLVEIQSHSEAKNSQGIVVKTFTKLKDVWVNFQPKTLSSVQASAWGVNDQTANSKWMGFDPDETIRELYRVIAKGRTYEIRGLNPWPSHGEAFLIPVQGIAIETSCVSLDAEPLNGYEYVWLDDSYWLDDGIWFD